MKRRSRQRGNPHQTRCDTERSISRSTTSGFGGEGHWLVLHVDKGNTTCSLKGFNKAWHWFYIS
eukprot:15147097-Ditylum_brightwellii.AAC.1